MLAQDQAERRIKLAEDRAGTEFCLPKDSVSQFPCRMIVGHCGNGCVLYKDTPDV